MKRKLPMVTDAQLAVLEEFRGRGDLALYDLPTESHPNRSILVDRMIRFCWLTVVGRERNPVNGSRSRVFEITELGRAAREYGKAERATRKKRA